MKIYRLNINVSKIDKALLVKGEKGAYLNASLIIGDEPDRFGNDASITQELPKERRDAGEKATYIGTGKLVFERGESRREAKPKEPQPEGNEPW